jgi:hypothetical protein
MVKFEPTMLRVPLDFLSVYWHHHSPRAGNKQQQKWAVLANIMR